MTVFKNSCYEDLIVPNTFWCTFMHAEAKQQAIELQKFKFSDSDPKIREKIKIKEPKAPSDIKWLNQGVNYEKQWKRIALISTIIFLTAIGSQILFSVVISVSVYIQGRKNPLNVNCESVFENYEISAI